MAVLAFQAGPVDTSGFPSTTPPGGTPTTLAKDCEHCGLSLGLDRHWTHALECQASWLEHEAHVLRAELYLDPDGLR